MGCIEVYGAVASSWKIMDVWIDQEVGTCMNIKYQ
jgi:hypothetical protein